MKEFIKAFRRESDGSWTCIEDAEHELPAGRVRVTRGARFTRGTVVCGVELARLLDEQHAADSQTSTHFR